MRTIGIGILGLIGGALAAIVLQDILARLLIEGRGRPSAPGLVLGSLFPVFAIVGAVLVVWLDRRHHRHRR